MTCEQNLSIKDIKLYILRIFPPAGVDTEVGLNIRFFT